MTKKQKHHNLDLIKKPRFEPYVHLNDVFCELIKRLNEAIPIGNQFSKEAEVTRSCSVTEEEWKAIKRLISEGEDPLKHLFSDLMVGKYRGENPDFTTGKEK